MQVVLWVPPGWGIQIWGQPADYGQWSGFGEGAPMEHASQSQPQSQPTTTEASQPQSQPSAPVAPGQGQGPAQVQRPKEVPGLQQLWRPQVLVVGTEQATRMQPMPGQQLGRPFSPEGLPRRARTGEWQCLSTGRRQRLGETCKPRERCILRQNRFGPLSEPERQEPDPWTSAGESPKLTKEVDLERPGEKAKGS